MQNEERERLDTDRWKSDGNCEYCTRKYRCVEICEANKNRRFERFLLSFPYEQILLKDIKESK